MTQPHPTLLLQLPAGAGTAEQCKHAADGTWHPLRESAIGCFPLVSSSFFLATPSNGGHACQDASRSPQQHMPSLRGWHGARAWALRVLCASGAAAFTVPAFSSQLDNRRAVEIKLPGCSGGLRASPAHGTAGSPLAACGKLPKKGPNSATPLPFQGKNGGGGFPPPVSAAQRCLCACELPAREQKGAVAMGMERALRESIWSRIRACPRQLDAEGSTTKRRWQRDGDTAKCVHVRGGTSPE